MASAKIDTKDRNAQWKKEKAEKAKYFDVAASASSKKEESSEDEDEDEFYKKDFMNSFIESWKTSQKNKKSQKNKRKCSNNDTSDSDEEYLQSFKSVALKIKRAKVGIPTTEVIGETTVQGKKKPSRILIYTGSSSSIIFKKCINKNVLERNSRTTT
jgi:hypothetical protein